jgi:hypothetical protein
MMLAMTVMLIGVLLGLRFKVLILVPAIVVGSTAALWSGIAYNDSLRSILLVTAATITALQFGYLGGTIISWYKKSVRLVPCRRQQTPA